jgi:hypothetical protein
MISVVGVVVVVVMGNSRVVTRHLLSLPIIDYYFNLFILSQRAWLLSISLLLILVSAWNQSIPLHTGMNPQLPQPLASTSQLISTPSTEDGVPKSVENDLRVAGCMLIQEAGIMLNLYVRK